MVRNNHQPRPRAVVADDHTLIAQGIARLLEPECDVVGIAGTGRELLQVIDEKHPDLVIADLSMPELNGIDAIQIIRSKWPEMAVIMLTMHADLQYAAAAFRAGAQGFVEKRAAAAELSRAVRQVLSGGTYAPQQFGEQLLKLGEAGELDVLTPRQREVLQLLAEGRAAKEIAHRMNISVKTVEFHRAAISQRLGLKTTAELTKYAVEHGLTPGA